MQLHFLVVRLLELELLLAFGTIRSFFSFKEEICGAVQSCTYGALSFLLQVIQLDSNLLPFTLSSTSVCNFSGRFFPGDLFITLSIKLHSFSFVFSINCCCNLMCCYDVYRRKIFFWIMHITLR